MNSKTWVKKKIVGPVERLPIDAKSPWWGEHRSRYRLAQTYVKDKCVLDVACGTGYGLLILQASARSLVGVDIDFGAAQKSQNQVAGGCAHVIVADACRLPFADRSFDAITSFETLEHLEQRKEFLAELRRVLSPEGICIISTPNANHTLPQDGKPRNPYHLHEYSPTELVAELDLYFSNIQLLGQKLHDRFVISPFWDDQQRFPRALRSQTRLYLWRILNKLPLMIRERVSQALWKHPFSPADTDYHFSSTSIEGAPVLLALCRGLSREVD